ncbi:MAG: PGN_0703 family putative restriction endonuclease [Acidimicrobiales bacterium]
MGLQFNRNVSPELLAEIRPGGRFDGLVRRRNELPTLADVQLRRAQGPECHASLYIGLTSVLNVRERRGEFALSTHRTHRAAGGFDPSWSVFQSAATLAQDWPAVEGYLDRLLDGRIDPRWYRREGVLHALLCSGQSKAYGVVQREAAPWADGPPLVRDVVDATSDLIWAASQAAGRAEPWWPGIRDRGVRKPMGDELDVLAVDDQGRLLCMEAKPAEETAGIVWSVAQVLVYAELFARWVAQDPAAAASTIAAMAEQRAALGLLDANWSAPLGTPFRVVPVVAIGPGLRSPVALKRLAQLSAELESVTRHSLVDPVEVWLLDSAGDPAGVWRPTEGPPPSGRGVAVPPPVLLGAVPDTASAVPTLTVVPVAPTSAFVTTARKAAAAWKAADAALPPEAKVPASYDGKTAPLPFVLPEEHRWLNLLPEAREIARTRFEAAAIEWHGGGDGPNSHLLSSQVQCLNALAPLVDRPVDLARWLGGFLPVAEVIPFGAQTESLYDATDHVVFEWQGLVDHLGEWDGAAPTRGSRATSIDAAVRYRSPAGAIEMALIEWKYTESYPYGGRLGGSAFYHQRRLDRYRELASDPDSPVLLNQGVDYEDLFAEPTYQLFRQQLMAWRIEVTGELDVTRAVVVHAAPAANAALLTDSLAGHRFRRLAEANGGLIGGWRRLLRRSDRFVSVDTSALAGDGSPCSEGFRRRYAHLLTPVSTPVPIIPPVRSPADGGLPSTMSGSDLAALAYEEESSGVWVGRAGGLSGTALADDIATGAWRTRLYKVANGNAAPNGQWFALDDLLDKVREARIAARAAIGWGRVGVVPAGSASGAFALPGAVVPLPPGTDIRDGHRGVVGFVTFEEKSLPVEVRRTDGVVVEARMDVVNDVDDQPGTWQPAGILDVEIGGVVAVDPHLRGEQYRVHVDLPPGRWRAEVFNSDGDNLALRLVPDR